MGNTCKSNYKTTNDYDIMEEDGAPYHRPRTFSSHFKRMSNFKHNQDSLDTEDDGLKAKKLNTMQSKGRERTNSFA